LQITDEIALNIKKVSQKCIGNNFREGNKGKRKLKHFLVIKMSLFSVGIPTRERS
jgi:hypothetical protein